MSDKDAPIMMGNTKPMVITGVVKVKIAKPDFDITKHKFSDENIRVLDVTDDVSIDFYLNDLEREGFIQKIDAIAIAKHFKLTGDDL